MSQIVSMLNTIQNAEVKEVFENYPLKLQGKLLELRELIVKTADECKDIKKFEETLKWGEPSYVSNIGSTIRLGTVKTSPNEYALYFHCKAKLLDTFRELYSDIFTFEGNRAIIFNESDTIAIKELEHCILMSLKYHKIKNKPAMDI